MWWDSSLFENQLKSVIRCATASFTHRWHEGTNVNINLTKQNQANDKQVNASSKLIWSDYSVVTLTQRGGGSVVCATL